MRFFCFILAALMGCHTQTDIKRSVTRADGSTEVYENHSDGYNYNPNYTGTFDNTNNTQVHSNYNQNMNFAVPAYYPQNQYYGNYGNYGNQSPFTNSVPCPYPQSNCNN